MQYSDHKAIHSYRSIATEVGLTKGPTLIPSSYSMMHGADTDSLWA